VHVGNRSLCELQVGVSSSMFGVQTLVGYGYESLSFAAWPHGKGRSDDQDEMIEIEGMASL